MPFKNRDLPSEPSVELRFDRQATTGGSEMPRVPVCRICEGVHGPREPHVRSPDVHLAKIRDDAIRVVVKRPTQVAEIAAEAEAGDVPWAGDYDGELYADAEIPPMLTSARN